MGLAGFNLRRRRLAAKKEKATASGAIAVPLEVPEEVKTEPAEEPESVEVNETGEGAVEDKPKTKLSKRRTKK